MSELIRKYNPKLIANNTIESVLEARKSLDKVKQSKAKYSFGGKNKQSVIDTREGALKKLLVSNNVNPTDKGMEIIKDASFKGVSLNLQLGYSMVFTEEQEESINQLKIGDKNWLALAIGQAKEKEIIKAHINCDTMRITKRNHVFSFEDNQLFAESTYTMRSSADEIADSFQDCYESKALNESRHTEKSIEDLSKSELKLLCKKQKLKVSGSKAVLLKRLQN